MRLHEFMNQQALHAALLESLKRLMSKRTREYVHLALSGGNTPLEFFRYWVQEGSACDWSRLHLWWVDERCVPPTDSRSNYLHAQRNLLEPLGIPEERVHRMRGEGLPSHAALEYAHEMECWLGTPENGTAELDLILLGMGPDGHVASWFPGVEIQKPHPWVGVSRSPDGMSRLTLTEKILCSARQLSFLVTGNAKQELVRGILGKNAAVAALPAAILSAERPDAQWYFTCNTEV